MKEFFLGNKFVVVIPFFNAQNTIERAILSVLQQDYDDLGIIIRNDVSTDGSDEIVKKIFGLIDGTKKVRLKIGNKDIIYIVNEKKLYGAGNTYESVISYVRDPKSIIGVVDGDDFLLVKNAVSTIAREYITNPSKWLIWSQHISRVQSIFGYEGFSLPLPNDKTIYSTRQYWGVSHFRTCVAGLYHLINPIDLCDPLEPTNYPKVCGDAAILYPIIEMCGNKSSLFVNKTLYYYNDGLLTNDAEVYKSEIGFYKKYFENKKQYTKLNEAFDFSSIRHLRYR